MAPIRFSTHRGPGALLGLSVAFASLVLVGVVYADDSSPTDINKMCPVMTDEEVDPELTTVFQGKTVAFCCDRCIKKFRANPQKYVSRLPQFQHESPGTPASNQAATGGAVTPADIDAAASHDDTGAGDAHEDSGHESHIGPDTDGDDDDVPFLGRIHPILIHFPIAGVPLALLGFLVWMATGRDAFARADVVPIMAGALSSITAVVTGNIAHDAMRFSKNMHEIVERHQTLSTAAMIVIIVLAVFRAWRWNRLVGPWRWCYASGLIVACGLLGATGYFGGTLVFGADHLSW